MTSEDRSHELRLENNGEDSLKNYQEKLQEHNLNLDPVKRIQPYSAVILDCKMPKINGIEVGKKFFLSTHVRE